MLSILGSFHQKKVNHTVSAIKKHSIVLVAIINANYEFITCDVGTNCRVSHEGVTCNAQFYEHCSWLSTYSWT